MIYPRYIQNNDTIGVCAPSDGISDKIKQKRLDNAYKKLKEINLNMIETNSVRKSELGESNIIKARVKELESLYTNKNVNYIICASGGDFLVEILPHLNYDIIKKNIKWLQGYSDPTALLFTLTTNYDIATIYGYNIGSYGMKNWHSSIYDSINLVKGNIQTLYSLDYYENDWYDYKTGLESFHKDYPVEWKNLYDEKEIIIHGRIIGGCLDVLLNLIGTKYDKTKEFIEKYKNDGIIWYFDNCELTSEGLRRAIWQLKESGWFNYTNGIIFGRSMTNKSFYNISFQEALKTACASLNIPVIWDADIGHKCPMLSIINGSIATIKSSNGKGSITQELK